MEMEMLLRWSKEDGIHYYLELEEEETGEKAKAEVLNPYYSGGLVLLSPEADDETKYSIFRFVKENAEPEDFECPVFVRRHRTAHAPVRETCYSMTQALDLAAEKWKSSSSPYEDWEQFYIEVNGVKIMDFLKS